MERLKKMDYEVLLLPAPLDELVVTSVGEIDGKRLVDCAKDDLSDVFGDDDDGDDDAGDFAGLCEAAKEFLGDKVSQGRSNVSQGQPEKMCLEGGEDNIKDEDNIEDKLMKDKLMKDKPFKDNPRIKHEKDEEEDKEEDNIEESVSENGAVLYAQWQIDFAIDLLRAWGLQQYWME